jgi:hypothetical protein
MDGMEFVIYATEQMDSDAVRFAAELFAQTFIVPIGWTFPDAFNETVQSMIDATSEAVAAVTSYIGISGSQ